MIHTVIRIVSHTHTCSYLLGKYIFLFISKKNRTLYNRFDSNCVPPMCVLVSNCYLVMIFFIRIIHEKFEFTLHAHSWSFTNEIVLCRLGSIHVIFLSYYYREITELNWNIYMICAFPNKNWCEFQNFYILPHLAVDSAQWDVGISCVTKMITTHFQCT